MRTKMTDNAQLFTAYHYIRDDVTKNIDLDNDIPTPFEFTWFEEKGDVKGETFIVPNRRTSTSSAMIETDYDGLLNDNNLIVPDSIVRIDGIEYNVSKVTPIHNSSYDLRAVRGAFSNITYIIELDT